MLDRLDAAAVRRWCLAALDGLRRHQRQIDEMNVYPVPDGDTGTNLVLTVSSAHRALAAEPDTPEPQGSGPGTSGPGTPGAGTSGPGAGTAASRKGDAGAGPVPVTPLGRVLRCMAHGALLGARGNSGVILAQLLRGLADSLSGVARVGGRQFSAALAVAADAGYTAVARPVEGTMLTVARGAADAAARVDSDDLVAVVRAAADGADQALRRTPELLPVLARAGVVDAGGCGLVVFLRALLEVVSGEAAGALPAGLLAAATGDARLLVVERETGSDEYAYEVQYLLDAEPEAVEGLKRVLSGLGDSLVVVGGLGASSGDPATHTWNVHVHVNDVGAAVEAGVEAGRPYRISVSRFADQAVPAAAAGTAASGVGQPAPPSPGSGVVAVCSGAGLMELFRAEGVVVVDGGPTRNPSTSQILAAVRSTGERNVVVLPNDDNVLAVADAAAREAYDDGVTVRVVHTHSPVQGVAALAVRDPERPFDDDVIAMAEAAGACRYAELTTATREALTIAGRCQPGDVLALLEGEVALIGAKLADTARDLLDRMLAGGGELVTLVTGADAPADLADTLRRHLHERWPFVECQCYTGGQPYYPLLVGVE